MIRLRSPICHTNLKRSHINFTGYWSVNSILFVIFYGYPLAPSQIRRLYWFFVCYDHRWKLLRDYNARILELPAVLTECTWAVLTSVNTEFTAWAMKSTKLNRMILQSLFSFQWFNSRIVDRHNSTIRLSVRLDDKFRIRGTNRMSTYRLKRLWINRIFAKFLPIAKIST